MDKPRGGRDSDGIQESAVTPDASGLSLYANMLRVRTLGDLEVRPSTWWHAGDRSGSAVPSLASRGRRPALKQRRETTRKKLFWTPVDSS